jgi:hypothetical protein
MKYLVLRAKSMGSVTTSVFPNKTLRKGITMAKEKSAKKALSTLYPMF